jgi:tetratricopeptide (TPR) repeat protein
LIYIFLGWLDCTFNLGRYDDAVAIYDSILSLEPDYEANLQTLQGKGSGLFDLERYDEAM